MAKIELEISYNKSINREPRILGVDSDLYAISGEMEQYKGYHISDIDPIRGIVTFTNGETIARGDASTAWCLSQAGGCSMSAAYLALPVAQEIFGDDPRAVLAWGPGHASGPSSWLSCRCMTPGPTRSPPTSSSGRSGSRERGRSGLAGGR